MAIGRKVLKIRAQKKRFTFKYEGVEQPKGVQGKYYPAEDVVVKKGPTPTRNAPKLKKGIVPGTVLILLGGRFRGKRVVFLKQLESGLLLVSGPYAVNGVPLRRVNQRFVIATSTTVDIKSVDTKGVTDKTFARAKSSTADPDAPKVVDPARLALQKTVDDALVAAVKKTDMLESYLKALFTISKNDRPHLMKF
jgi:large subunit ribosomal protein L6e